MILEVHSDNPITANVAAKQLVMAFGDQLRAMGSDEWAHLVQYTLLTDKEEIEIRERIYMHLMRVRKYLRV